MLGVFEQENINLANNACKKAWSKDGWPRYQCLIDHIAQDKEHLATVMIEVGIEKRRESWQCWRGTESIWNHLEVGTQRQKLDSLVGSRISEQRQYGGMAGGMEFASGYCWAWGRNFSQGFPLDFGNDDVKFKRGVKSGDIYLSITVKAIKIERYHQGKSCRK